MAYNSVISGKVYLIIGIYHCGNPVGVPLPVSSANLFTRHRGRCRHGWLARTKNVYDGISDVKKNSRQNPSRQH